MINLRYHIVSVVAVFLALGIGLALGSTFVDSILVNELEDQVNQLDLAQEEAVELKNQAEVERDLELQNNQALRTQIVALENDHLAKLAELQEANDQERQALINQAELESESTKSLLNSVETLAPRGRLSGTSWVLLAPTAAERSVIAEIRKLLTRSDGEYLGTLWIRPSMDFEDEETVQELSEMYGEQVPREKVASATISNLATALSAARERGNAANVEVKEFIERLIEMGLVRYDRYQATSTIDELSNAVNSILIVNDPAHITLHQQLFVPLIQEISDRGARGVGAILELKNPNTPRGEVVDRIRNDSGLAKTWSTFDDVDSFEARVGLLVGLDRLPIVGHYGDLPTAEERYPR